MSFKSRFGITNIKNGKIDNFSLSIDENNSIKPVILYTPDMNNTNEHFHIELSKTEATKLRDWLNSFLELDQATLKYKYLSDLKKKRK